MLRTEDRVVDGQEDARDLADSSVQDEKRATEMPGLPVGVPREAWRIREEGFSNRARDEKDVRLTQSHRCSERRWTSACTGREGRVR